MAEDKIDDFPRGGAEVLTPLETRKIRESAQKDVLFGNFEPEKKKIKKKQKKESLDEKNENSKSIAVDHFSFKYLTKGLLILGYVKEVYKSDIVIGLPNSLSGFISISDLQTFLSDAINSNEDQDTDSEDEESKETSISARTLFSVGQLVPVTIKQLYPSKQGYQKIYLSVLPQDVNISFTKSCFQSKMLIWGMVQSVEDHGYVISLGKDNISGFLRGKDSSTDALKVGMLKWFCIKKGNPNKKVLNLSIDRETLCEAQVADPKVHFNSLFPGQLLKMTITEISEDALCGKIFESFDGVIESLHSMQYTESVEKLLKKKVKGRIIHVNPKTKQVGITLSPDVVSFSENVISKDYQIGDIIEDCEVIRFESSYGLFFKLPEDRFGVVHISRISDEHTDKISKKFKSGTKHRCRVLGYSALDHAYTLTMKKSDLQKSFLRYDDLKPGMMISGTVISLEEFGVLVSVTKQIRGLCPKLHLSDIILKHPERKFEEGKKLKFRVLYVKPESRKLVLTHKKTLLKSKFPLITSAKDVKVGDTVHGFVSKIKTFGIFVSFYNEIKALLPKSEINVPKDASLPDLYYVGQVLQCTVITVNEEENKLVVSLKPQDGSFPPQKSLGKGEIADGTLLSVGNDHSLTLLCNGKEYNMPSSHFSDFEYLNSTWKNLIGSMKNDFKMCGLVGFGFDKKKKQNIISNKQVLLQDGGCVKCFEDLKVGVVCGGVVSHIMPYGIFVDVSPDLTGLIPTSQLADRFVKSAGDMFQVGQSLVVKVTAIDEEKRRFLITSKPSLLRSEAQNNLSANFSGVPLLKAYLKQTDILLQYASKCADAAMEALSSLVGEIIIAKVVIVNHDGVFLSYHIESDDVDVSGFIPQPLRYGCEFEVGTQCQCYVFAVDLKEKKFCATTHEDAIAAVIKNKKDFKNTEFQGEGKKINSLVVDITNDVVTLLLPNQDYQIAHMPARKHLNELSDISKRLQVGGNIYVKFESIDDMGVIVSNVDDVDDISKITIGSVLTAVVKGIKPMQLSVTMINGAMHGRVHISNIHDELIEGKSVLSKFQPQQLVKAKITGFKDLKTHNYLPITQQNVVKSLAELSLKPSVIASDDNSVLVERKELSDFKKGDSVFCYITSVTKKCIWVTINPFIKGSVSTLHFSDNIKELKKLPSTVKQGFGYKAVVVGHNDAHNCLELSRIGDPAKLIVEGSVVTGRISRIMADSLLIELPNHKAGLVHLTEIHDKFEEEAISEFSLNQIVRCKILKVKKGGQIDLSLRKSRITGEDSEDIDRAIDGYDDINEGDILRGYVKSCTKVGVFVSLSFNITGRVQIKNLSQYFVKSYADALPVGKLVKAKVLSINPSNNNIDLSLRGKDVGTLDLFPAPKRKAEGDEEGDNDDESSPGGKRRKIIEESDSDSDSDDSDSGIEASEDETKEKSKAAEIGGKPCLQLSTPFDWNADISTNIEDHSSDSELSDEENKNTLRKKTKRQKRAAKKAEEEYVHKAELALLDTESRLESADDFDRLLLGSPNSSMLWIQYMAFHLHSAEIDRARSVAERALKTISFREEQEKFNVWVALLNLESIYGRPESLEKTFQNALKVNDPKMVYMKMVDLYIKKENNEEAEKLYLVMIKKFRTSLKVWTGYGYFLMKTGQVEAGRKLLQRSLKSLHQRKHIETIVKFAVMEYKMGEPNRGATIFESILKNYPKRIDLWSIYIDMNIKLNDVEQVRNTFERATSLVLSSKKMKFLFKRYLTFEEQYGSKSSVEAVRKKAMEYVENKIVED